jgi:hypothetical protein
VTSSWKLFEDLLRRWPRLCLLAEALESPNAEDDFQVKLAIVGFSATSKTERWERPHYEFVRTYRESDLAKEVLGTHGPDAPAWEAFACLAVGALLGARDTGSLSEQNLSLALAHLPGFMWLNASVLTTAQTGG